MAPKVDARKDEKRRRGRPPLKPSGAKRSSFNTRLTLQLKKRLVREAATTGRSLSEEIEVRLEQSFQLTDFSLQGLGVWQGMGFEHPDERSFVHHLGIMFNNIRGVTNHDSLIAGAESFVEVEAGILEFFKALRGAKNRDFAGDAEAYDIEDGFGRQFGKGLGELYAKHWRSEERLAALMIGEKYEEERPEPKRWRRTKKKGGA